MVPDTAAPTHQMFSGSAARPPALLTWQHSARCSLSSTQVFFSQTTARLRLGASTARDHCQRRFACAFLCLDGRGSHAMDAGGSLGPHSSPGRASLATTDTAKRHVCPAS